MIGYAIGVAIACLLIAGGFARLIGILIVAWGIWFSVAFAKCSSAGYARPEMVIHWASIECRNGGT